VRCRAGKLGDNFRCSGFAYCAVAIPNAALGEREFAAASAGFCVEAMQSGEFLRGRQLGEVHAGELAGAIGVGEKNLAGIVEGLDARVDRHTEKGANFVFVQQGIAKPFVFLHDAALSIKHEGRGEGRDSAIFHAKVRRGHSHRIVYAGLFDDFFDGGSIVFIDGQTDDLQAICVFRLQLDQVGDFRAARTTPGGPEIQEDDFAVRIGESNGLAVQPWKMELRRGIRIADKADDVVLGQNESREREQ